MLTVPPIAILLLREPFSMIRGPMAVPSSRAQPARYAVVLAGGFGTRFWPHSRRRRPKQFLAILNRRTMLQETVHRLRGLVPAAHILVVASAEFAPTIRQQVPALSRAQLLIEPAARGTAPCLALAAEWIARRDPNAMMGVFPSDHAIQQVAPFRRAVRRAFAIAQDERCLVTFGIVPTAAETGYGYIELGKTLDAGVPRAHWVARFHEKPTAAKAAAYVRSGCYRWNSGMFIWRVDVIRDAFARHAPRIARAAQAAAARPRDARAVEPYRRLRGESVDVAILEQAKAVAVVDGKFGWSDVGSWAALPDIWGTDAAGNAVRGAGMLIDCDGTLVFAQQERLVAAVGMRDVVIVDTPDAVLVCPRSRAQDVRRVVEQLTQMKRRRWL
jgi:mannose-1-phosphate guanylyltransferase